MAIGATDAIGQPGRNAVDRGVSEDDFREQSHVEVEGIDIPGLGLEWDLLERLQDNQKVARHKSGRGPKGSLKSERQGKRSPVRLNTSSEVCHERLGAEPWLGSGPPSQPVRHLSPTASSAPAMPLFSTIRPRTMRAFEKSHTYSSLTQAVGDVFEAKGDSGIQSVNYTFSTVIEFLIIIRVCFLLFCGDEL